MKQLCVSIDDTQRALGVGRTTVYKLIQSGRLETVKIGRRTLVRTASIRAVSGEPAPSESNEAASVAA